MQNVITVNLLEHSSIVFTYVALSFFITSTNIIEGVLDNRCPLFFSHRILAEAIILSLLYI